MATKSRSSSVDPGPDGLASGALDEPVSITGLLSYRLHRVANAISRSAAARYRRDFEVSLGEWRTIALLGEKGSLTLNKLARMAGLDKAQMSRVVAKLVERGLVAREPGAGRTIHLSLTRKGRSMYRGLIAAANERNQAFLVCLTEEERTVLDSALEKLGTVARALET
ncbi:MAG TPA: MarR family transcriptional regulator [Solirubrobacterales bacterium]